MMPETRVTSASDLEAVTICCPPVGAQLSKIKLAHEQLRKAAQEAGLAMTQAIESSFNAIVGPEPIPVKEKEPRPPCNRRERRLAKRGKKYL